MAASMIMLLTTWDREAWEKEAVTKHSQWPLSIASPEKFVSSSKTIIIKMMVMVM